MARMLRQRPVSNPPEEGNPTMASRAATYQEGGIARAIDLFLWGAGASIAGPTDGPQL